MTADLRVQAHRSIHDIPQADWDACAGSANPFVRHAFLSALEDSGSATQETGWMAQHLSLTDGNVLLGVMPLYLKNHSYGEYVFDHGWADAYERAGGRYYPKLQSSVPFTPATGPRLLVPPGPDAADHARALAAGASALAEQLKVSSLHVTFAEPPQHSLLEDSGYLLRQDVQFHWYNRDYDSFDAFLASLSSRKRKQIRKERREAAEGIEFVRLTGTDLTEAIWDRFFAFYQDTGMRKWGHPYLTRSFFSLLGERMGDRVILVGCQRGDEMIAGALNLLGEDCLYGRYWGCLEDQRYLHFETCYYQAIDIAIEKGLSRVEAGAQGQHKLARGYEPTTTWSAHWLRDPGFRAAVADYLSRERRHMDAESEALQDFTPFRKLQD